MNDFITVCVLSYNRKGFIEQSIESMVKTASDPFELIVHDDGSDRDTQNYLLSLFDQGVISQLILQPRGHNQGQGEALNKCFNAASGEIICKADQDLIYKSGWDSEIKRVFDSSANKYLDAQIESIVGCLGLFKYHHEPVKYEDMLIEDHGDWEEHKDFVGSFMAISRPTWEVFGPFETHSDAFAEDAVFKQKIYTDEQFGYCLGLTKQDYIENIGFGVGPSTLVKGFDDNGEGILEKIHKTPKLINPEDFK